MTNNLLGFLLSFALKIKQTTWFFRNLSLLRLRPKARAFSRSKALLLSSIFMFCLGSVVAQTNARIAFVTFRGEVATVDALGNDLKILSEGAQQFQFPAWSPDGTKLAAIGLDAESGFINIFEDDESAAVREIYRSRRENPFYMYWSPDSQRISFLANHPTSGIALHVASETVPDQILAQGAPLYWDWTSDSQQLFIHSGLNRADARLGFSSRVRDTLSENLAAPGRFQAPGISPSGRYLAYAVDDAQGPRVLLSNNPTVNSDTLERELPHQGVAAMTWNPVKDQLALMSPVQDSDFFFGPISLLDAETGLLEPVSSQIALAFFWSPDGRYLAYLAPSQGGTSADASQLVSDGLQQVQLSAFLTLNIIDTQTTEERELTRFLPSGTFVRQFLPFFDQYALSHSIWSPNSDALVLAVTRDTGVEVTVFGLDGTVTGIAEGDTPFWNRK